MAHTERACFMDISKFSSSPLTLLAQQSNEMRPVISDERSLVKIEKGEKLTLSQPLPYLPSSPPNSSLSELYKPQPTFIQHSISNTLQSSDQTQKFTNQLNDENSDNRFKGLGTRFNELLNKPTESYHQELRQYHYQSQNSSAGNVDFSEFIVSSKTRTQAFDLELKTKSGATIQFSIESFSGRGKNPDTLMYEFEDFSVYAVGQHASFRSTEISFDVQGDLTKEEIKQLQQFSENLEAFSTTLFNNGVPSLKTLDLASFDVISELNLNSMGGTSKPLLLEYKNNDEERFIEVNYDGNKAQIQLTKLGQMVYSEQNKEQVIQHYLDILKDSAEKAQADDIQAQLMQDVFSAGFNINEDELERAKEIEQDRTNELTSQDASDAEKSKDALLPIPDFSFHFVSHKERFNIAQKPEEYSGFTLELSVNTRQQTEGPVTATKQQQNFKLEGAYYKSLGHLEKPDFLTQTYRHNTFNYDVSNTVTTSTGNQQLLSATLEQNNENSESSKAYSKGVLIDDKHEEEEPIAKLADFTERLRLEAELTQQQILEDVLIDPFADR
ncbi:hypothetical protein OLEAN_C11220 [Oleispira antarctica RB-8]|uniref:Uncharacterized protein n=1 Tax=Oleispira antarctica RB-8 TaxID=698738 RepID=R4YPW0_OLEAN|nr:hypothetical protein OLEAN_C11220 [Oleispira antarctica RB-8]